jgi:hypothetical protein
MSAIRLLVQLRSGQHRDQDRLYWCVSRRFSPSRRRAAYLGQVPDAVSSGTAQLAPEIGSEYVTAESAAITMPRWLSFGIDQ